MNYNINSGMYDKIMNLKIQRLYKLTEESINTLNENHIFTLGELSKKKTTDLGGYGFESKEIRKIERELELLGLKLKNSN